MFGAARATRGFRTPIRGWIAFALAGIALTAPVAAQISVTFEKIAQAEIDLVPGREALNVRFRGQYYTPEKAFGAISMPAINDAGEAVFRGQGSTPFDFNLNATTGLYVKRPGFPLARLVDDTLTAGSPTFPVPGRPAGARFTNFDLPLVNNAGDVVFRASFSGTGGGGSGIYATTTLGGSIVKIADSFDPVPGFTSTPMNQPLSFGFSFARPSLISLNNVGQIVFVATFFRQGAPFIDTGIYGTTVSGGGFVRLADSTLTVFPAGETLAFNQITSNYPPALSDTGTAVFFGGIGPSLPDVRQGVFIVPADGSAPASTVARRTLGTSPPLSDGVARAWTTSVGPSDINGSDLIFHHTFGALTSSSLTAVFTRAALAGPLTTVVDDIPVIAGGYAVPGRPGANFIDVFSGAMNTAGEFSLRALDSTSFPEGLYATDVDKRPLRVVARAGEVPPGRVSPARFTSLTRTPAINASGNMALAPEAQDEGAPAIGVFGLYFYNNCTSKLERVFDRATTTPALPVGLGVTIPASCSFPCERGVRLLDDINGRNGGYRSLNAGNTIAFSVAYGPFESGAFLAHVTAPGGDVQITCPPDMTIECPSLPDPLLTGQPTASGCGAVTLAYSDAETVGACTGARVITRTWTASTTSQSASCVQTITIVDTTAPELVIPVGASIDCSASTDPADTGLASASDECDPAPTITYGDATVPGSCVNQYEIHRTWTATDACGNASSGVQIISVGDTQLDVLTLPPDAQVSCGDSTDPANTGSATAVGGCDDPPQVTYSDAVISAGTCGGEKVIERTWTATDSCGNVTSAVQRIEIIDVDPPVITAPAGAEVACGASTDPAETGTASAGDLCDGPTAVTYSDTVIPGNCPAEQTIIRTWSSMDACGNVASAQQIIQVSDNAAPVISIPSNATVECGASTDVDATGYATASDACSEVVALGYSDSVADGACAANVVRVITRTWTATDACENTISVAQTITVIDTTAPVLSVPADVTVACGDSTDTALTGDASAGDVCDPAPMITFVDSTEPGDCPLVSVVVRTWTATDACGNVASATQRISLIDTVAPQISCPPDVTVTLDPGDCAADGLDIGFALATDLCSEPLVTSNAPAVFAAGVTYVTWTATDACGNTTSCVQTVTVEDAQAPTISISLASTMLWPPNHDVVSVGLAVTVSDACDGAVPPVVTVYCDEDDEMATGDGNHSPDARDVAAGTLRLRRERRGDADGRVYLVVVEATDSSGNVAVTSATVVVPHARNPASIGSVMAQASAAQAYFGLTQSPPPGYFLVGDGPVIGPQQ